MLDNYKKWQLFLAAGVFLCLFSCEKDEEQEVLDEENPVVSLEVTGSPAKLYNEVVLSSTATDNDAVERVVFYVNSDSIGQATSEPYELNWNTKEVEDGTYMLKAVAFDAAGNQAEAAKEVTVDNTLFVMNVGDNYPLATENIEQNIWVFLSDKDGQIIGEPKLLNEGESLRWERPSDFYADTIYLNRLVDYNYTQPSGFTSTIITVETFPDFLIEEATVGGGSYSPPGSVGEVGITVENDFEGTESYIYRTIVPAHDGYSSTSANTTSYSLSLGENSQQALSTYENIPARTEQHLREKHYRMDELEAGNEYVFHTSDYTPMEGQMVSFPANTTSARIVTFGYFNEELQGAYFIDNASSSGTQEQQLKIFTVDAFPYVRKTISGSVENRSFTYATLGSIPDELVLPEISASVETEELKNIEVAASGAFDLGRAYWNYTESSETQGLSAGRILYFGDEPTANYVLPEIPASLLELFPSLAKPMSYSNVLLIDYENVDSYEDFLSYEFLAADNGNALSEYFMLNINPESSGGRLQPLQETEPEHLTREKRTLMPKSVWPK